MMQYFTGTIVDAPDTDRGCRTKITVKVDGDADALWRNWSNGLPGSRATATLPKTCAASASSRAFA